MKIRTIYLIGGISFWFGALIGLKYDIESYDVQKHGQLISAKITFVPVCLGTRVKHHLRFQYIDNGVLKEYSKAVGVGLCGKLKVGQEIKFKADLEKKIFLYEFEDVKNEFYASALLGLAGLICIIFAFKKNNNEQLQTTG
jgi:hypothetical protein